MKGLKIDKEFQSLIPPLSDEEFSQLEENIKAEGCRDALVTWDGTIVDGHNRYKICQENDIPFKTEEKGFSSKEEATEWIIRNQFGRRNLSMMQRSELAMKLKPMIREKAKENHKANGGNKKAACENSNTPKIDTYDELAKIAGVSSNTIRRTEKILKEGTPEQIARARKGGKGNSVNAVYNEVVGKCEPVKMLPEDGQTKVCKQCGKELPATEFYEGKRACKRCLHMNRPYKDFKGNKIVVAPEIAALTEEEIIGDLYNVDKVVVHTIEDAVRDFTCNFETFLHTLDTILGIYADLIKEPENNKKIMAVLEEAVAAMKNLKGKYSYEKL